MRKLLISVLALSVAAGTVMAAKKKKDGSSFYALDTFSRVLHLIDSQYYRKVDKNKLIQGAIRGMMSTLDPHSTFLNEKLFNKIQEDTSGEFGGVGIEVSMKEGVIVVTTPLDDTPAFKAGIQPGDRIVEINYESAVGFTLDEAVDKMRGKSNTNITIGVQRKGLDKIKRYKLRREIIRIKPLKSEIIEDNFIYVRLSQFQKKSDKELVKVLKKYKRKLKKKGVGGIVLDLRYNPGGLLDQAINVASLFLRSGVVVSTEGRDPKDKELYYVKKSGYKELDAPLVVLINGASASASEIVAGALQDHKRGIIMGSTSFGKGSVQSVVKIDDKTAVKMTIRQYMTPAGKRIQAIGIKPNVNIPEYDAKFVQVNDTNDSFIREVDLRGHLTATIETKQEKKERLERSREERKKLINRVNQKRVIKDNKKGGRAINPKEDYLVHQAINYLKGYSALSTRL